MEAAEIEPVSSVNPKPLMAHDFGFYDMKTIELPLTILDGSSYLVRKVHIPLLEGENVRVKDHSFANLYCPADGFILLPSGRPGHYGP